MQINFDQLETQVIDGMKGGQGEARVQNYSDGDGRITKITLSPGAFLGEHAHGDSGEMVHVISGSGVMLCDGAEEPMEPGVWHYCPKGHTHKPVNTGTEPLIFFAIAAGSGK